MLALIPLLPFAGFLLNTTFGKRLPKGVSGAIATAAMGLAFGVSVAAVWRLLGTEPVGGVRAIDEVLYSWIASDRLNVPLAFRLDPLSSVMILVVTGIGTLIHLYSTAYMHEESDAEFARYFSYLNLFAAFMLVLVLGASFPVMFIGWEGVGLCSYLLIGFYYTKQSAADAGKKAFVVNRIGDFGFILGMAGLFATFGTLDFQGVARAVAELPVEAHFGLLTGLTLLLFLGATGKSAQLPLYVWLPDAMEGPTPVSALIHAATMVTAGVYMIGRNAVLFSHAPITLDVVAVVGCLTALMAGTIGLVQNDIKRVLAYSTVSQLGYMFLAMGVGAFSAGIFHLYTHAFFKALLFLGSGAVIHALHGEQDLRKMGGLKNSLPVTYWTFLIGTLAIAGVPLLSGFFSKDEILWKTFSEGHVVLWALAVVTAFLTATYMFRLLYMTFFGERRHGDDHAPVHHDAHGQHAHAVWPWARRRTRPARRSAGDGDRARCARGRIGPGRVRRHAERHRARRQPHRGVSRAELRSPARGSRDGGRCGGAPQRRSGTGFDGAVHLRRPRRYRRRDDVLPEGAGACDRDVRAIRRAPPAPPEQVLRGRGVRRDSRAADQTNVQRLPVARRGCRPD